MAEQEKKILYLNLYKQWYDCVFNGSKKVEYRDMSDYWMSRLLDPSLTKGKDLEELKTDIVEGEVTPTYQPYTHIQFKCGARKMLVELKKINVYRGHPMFCLSLGKIVEKQIK